jgi:hypothetical protein
VFVVLSKRSLCLQLSAGHLLVAVARVALVLPLDTDSGKHDETPLYKWAQLHAVVLAASESLESLPDLLHTNHRATD